MDELGHLTGYEYDPLDNIARVTDALGQITEYTFVSTTDNGLPTLGNQSYEIIFDAGKVIGTKGETAISVYITVDGGMLSAYPIKIGD